MAELLLGPLLRFVGQTDAVIWAETDRPCEVSVLGSSGRTFCVCGHHYALLHVQGLDSGTEYTYELQLDGARAWPAPGSDFPPSGFRTLPAAAPLRIAFGSCRVAAPNEPPWTLKKDDDDRGREIDALRLLALRMRELPREEWPDLLLLLGDQVYADEISPAAASFAESRRDTDEPPGDRVLDYVEYARLYRESWGEPVIRWLLSTVPTAMIFDDHDVHDDWNTSIEWVQEMRQKEWWRKRIVAAFESYLIYQHLGNLSPSERHEFELYEHLRTAPDPTPRLREFARRADEEVQGTRWSFCRDIGPARVVMIDSRAGRVLDPGNRQMVDPDEWRWIEEHASGGVQHLLIGTSLPMFMGPAMHWLEAWNEVAAD